MSVLEGKRVVKAACGEKFTAVITGNPMAVSEREQERCSDLWAVSEIAPRSALGPTLLALFRRFTDARRSTEGGVIVRQGVRLMLG